jgi:hypothetical protein
MKLADIGMAGNFVIIGGISLSSPQRGHDLSLDKRRSPSKTVRGRRSISLSSADHRLEFRYHANGAGRDAILNVDSGLVTLLDDKGLRVATMASAHRKVEPDRPWLSSESTFDQHLLDVVDDFVIQVVDEFA